MSQALFIVLLALGILMAPARPAQAVVDNPDVDTSAGYVYTVNPEDQSIDVTVTVTVTADKPNVTTDDGFYQYFFDGYGLAIPADVTDLTVTDGSGRELRNEVADENERSQAILVNFRSNLFYRQSTTFVVSYRMVEDRANENSLVRVNPAYAGLEIWTDPNLEAATVEVVTPPGFVVSSPYLIGDGPDQLRREVGPDEIRLIANSVDPEAFWHIVSLNRPDGLITDSTTVDDHEVIIRSWPGDDAWSNRARSGIQDGLPVLIETIGLDWPLDQPLTVTESFDPTLAGYAGWYDIENREISVGEDFDSHVMVHELSHAWFNQDMFEDRWITEGLANTYAAEAVDVLDGTRPEPGDVRRVAIESVPLAEWSRLESDPEVEDWAYAASWTVMDAVLDIVGKEALDAAVAAAYGDEVSYPGESDPEDHKGQTSWRYLLDLLENGPAGENEELRDLFAEWVVPGSNQSLLNKRRDHRDHYLKLVERGQGWAAPYVVRDQMSKWTFEAAGSRIEAANDVLDRREGLVDLLTTVEADYPDSLEAAYESSVTADLNEVNELFDKAESAAQKLVSSHKMVADATGLFQQVGAIGTDLPAELADSNKSFAAGDFESVIADNSDIGHQVDDLQQTGVLRSAIAAGTLLAFGLVLLWWMRRRRHRGQPGSEQPVDTPDDSGPASHGTIIDLDAPVGDPPIVDTLQ